MLSADLLDVGRRPTLAFRSQAIHGAGDNWRVDGELTIGEALAQAGLPASAVPYLDPAATVGVVLESLRSQREDRYFVAGTPTVVADEIERWLDEDGVDGINLRQYHSFDTARDFAELVVPELRRRGRLPQEGEVSGTLRERLFGAGRSRLPERHIGARYRGGANLDVPVEPLRLDFEHAASF